MRSKIGNFFSKNFLGLFYIFFSAISILLFMKSISPWGIGVRFDSVFYLDAAEKLLLFEPLKLFNNDWFVHWAPLYPFFISITSFLSGLKPFFALSYLHLVLYILFLFLLSQYIEKTYKNKIIKGVSFIFLAFSPTIFFLSTLAYSELLFLIPIMIFITYPDKLVEGRNLFLLGVATAIMASLTKYIGVTLLLSIVLFAFYKKRKIKEIFVFIIFSFFPIFTWIIRNYLLTGTFTGNRTSSGVGIFQNFSLMYKIIQDWFTPFFIEKIGLLLLFLSIYIIFIRSFKGNSKNNNFKASLLFLIVYFLLLLIAFTIIRLPALELRFLFPLYVPFFLIIFKSLEWILNKKKNLGILILIFFTLLFCSNIYNLKNSISKWGSEKRTKNSRLFYSDLSKYLKSGTKDSKIFSNAPHIVYFISKRKSLFSPRKIRGNIKDFKKIRKLLKRKKEIYLIWFKNSSLRKYYKPEEIGEYFFLIPYENFDEGYVFRITKFENRKINYPNKK